LKVKVDDLPEFGRVFHFHQTGDWFSSRISSTEDARELALVQPVSADLEIVPDPHQVKLSGRLQTAVRLSCSRCLQHFVINLDETMALALLGPVFTETPLEIDLRPQDLDTQFYDGVTIDVDSIITEQIFLALPQKPLCQRNCLGLCSGCGIDLNQEPCLCKKRETGSAFGALRAVKIDQQ
jgi:uncharacterized protein